MGSWNRLYSPFRRSCFSGNSAQKDASQLFHKQWLQNVMALFETQKKKSGIWLSTLLGHFRKHPIWLSLPALCVSFGGESITLWWWQGVGRDRIGVFCSCCFFYVWRLCFTVWQPCKHNSCSLLERMRGVCSDQGGTPDQSALVPGTGVCGEQVK